MKNWRLINFIEDKGAMQMAIDEAILEARSENLVPNTLRFFSWKPKAITIGFFQSMEKEIDAEKAKKLGVDAIRRYTGGGAVFHDNEITYSIVLSEDDVDRDIIKSYEKICSAIVNALKDLGLNAEFRRINDIIVNNKKISGNAQTRKKQVVLQHGTIILDVDVEKMFLLLKVPDEKIKDKLIKNASERVTSLKKELDKEIDVREIMKILVRNFEKVFNVGFKEQKLTEHEIKTAEKLCREKYSTKEWNYWR